MDDLIKALMIFRKYKNERCPTNCTHDEMAIMGVTIEEVSQEDIEELEDLGFEIDEDEGYFYSFRFGSA